ncbi:3-deoxy-manno-octulosonate cytidylyltransferase [Parazoarcus communis]|uniref:3-deoxy-manno-octulosonate cytidylyltransferase n=1 Tax=Parazoarcus communis TaxID=41977 RepID=A0A2U8HA86_9RHOO|nr:3-deoxy-manno-octulosonate cytidylyltransferase [Parazoarcus communis]AWI81665.1 3-deoxy-manno-octulosonate cytidylyltransferase [Parazoarcus communis]
MSELGSLRKSVRVVIPARFASSRLPGKPLVDLAGLPMIVRVARRVSEALPASDIVVATDDERIARVLESFDIKFMMTSVRHESGTDRAEEVAALCGWGEDDVVLNVQGDEPLVPVRLLQAFAAFCSENADLSMGTIAVPVLSVAEIRDPNVVKLTVDCNGNAIVFSRAGVPYCRDVPETDWPVASYLRHVGIYAYRRSVLRTLTAAPMCELEKLEKLEQLRALWIGLKISAMPWSEVPPHGVDTPADVERVSRLLAMGKV